MGLLTNYEHIAYIDVASRRDEECQTLKNVLENQDILVLTTDKGNVTVAINTTNYIHEVRKLLWDTQMCKPVCDG